MPQSPVHRVDAANLDIYFSEDNSVFTKVEGWKLEIGIKGDLHIALQEPVTARY